MAVPERLGSKLNEGRGDLCRRLQKLLVLLAICSKIRPIARENQSRYIEGVGVQNKILIIRYIVPN